MKFILVLILGLQSGDQMYQMAFGDRLACITAGKVLAKEWRERQATVQAICIPLIKPNGIPADSN